MKTVTSKTKEQYPLSPKKIIKKTITGKATLFAIGYFLMMMIISFSTPRFGTGFFITGLLITAVVIGLNYLYQRWYIAVYFYDLNDNFIIIRKGPITSHEIIVPYERIQDVYVDQDVVDRILGLYDVHLSTATVSSAVEAKIDGVEKEAAEGLRTLLLDAVEKKMGKKK